MSRTFSEFIAATQAPSLLDVKADARALTEADPYAEDQAAFEAQGMSPKAARQYAKLKRWAIAYVAGSKDLEAGES